MTYQRLGFLADSNFPQASGAVLAGAAGFAAAALGGRLRRCVDSEVRHLELHVGQTEDCRDFGGYMVRGRQLPVTAFEIFIDEMKTLGSLEDIDPLFIPGPVHADGRSPKGLLILRHALALTPKATAIAIVRVRSTP